MNSHFFPKTSIQLHPHPIFLSLYLFEYQNPRFQSPKNPTSKTSLMAENQNLVPNLSEIMNEYAHGEEKVHLEPQPETVITEEREAQPEAEQPTKEGRKEKR